MSTAKSYALETEEEAAAAVAVIPLNIEDRVTTLRREIAPISTEDALKEEGKVDVKLNSSSIIWSNAKQYHIPEEAIAVRPIDKKRIMRTKSLLKDPVRESAYLPPPVKCCSFLGIEVKQKGSSDRIGERHS